MENKKIIASFEFTLMMLSLFAFSYGIHMTDGTFEKISNKYIGVEKLQNINPKSTMANFVSIFNFIFNKMKQPMVPVVSAQSLGLGCCAMDKNGEKCATATQDVCSGEFAEGALCKDTSFCEKGCCFDAETGVYDENVLKSDCSSSWVADLNCNMPKAKFGCCVVGDMSFLDTQGQCKVRTLSFAQGDISGNGDSEVNWTSDSNEVECLLLSMTKNEGACVLANGDCSLRSESKCAGVGGQFNDGYLCTAQSLNTLCKTTNQTACFGGKDGVYFVDSCGNRANIYDSTRATDKSYWNKILSVKDICGDNSKDASANSTTCGNCNRLVGSICDSATANNFKVNMGDNYCKDMSCYFDGVKYKNEESWCVYDGAIGNGDDVVGSRHFKDVCSQGKVSPEACADYRRQICVQSNTMSEDGNGVVFRNAACIANNWEECLGLNSEENGINKCADTLNCRVQSVKVADQFKFDVCEPEYPEGFSFKDPVAQTKAMVRCGMATQTCKVIYAPKTWGGGCNLVANRACLTDKFAQQMNEMCRKIGDCGGEVNILGEYSASYEVKNSPDLSQEWIDGLKKLSEPVPGQFAKVGDYSKFLEAAGVWANPENAHNAGGVNNGTSKILNNGAMGVGAIGYAAAVWEAHGSLSLAGSKLLGYKGLAGNSKLFMGGKASVSGYAGLAIGAAIGYFAGAALAKHMGLSPGGSNLMAIGGSIVGAMAAYAWMYGVAALGPVGLAIIIFGVVLMIIASFFGGSDCNPVEVKFTCKPWQPPFGGENCEKCNNNPMKQCSEYRCNSLGAACEIVNKGTKQEMCMSEHDDGHPPEMTSQSDILSKGLAYSDDSSSGFNVTSIGGGCVKAYTLLRFGITTNKLAYCKFDIKPTEFKNMQFDFGGNAFTYNHTTVFPLPDPSHGQAQGSNWTGDLTLYTKCVDAFGHESPSFYEIKMCVKQGPDMMPPIIIKVVPSNSSFVRFNVTSRKVTVVTNELSTCKWDKSDVDYNTMSNSMTCNDTLVTPSDTAGYVCKSTVPTTGSLNTYYIRCMDQPWLNGTADAYKRNAKKQSFVYIIKKPDKKITIDWIEPNKEVKSPTDMTTIKLKVHTSGGGDYPTCSYSFSGYNTMIEMFETKNGPVHTQTLNMPLGENKIYVRCKDETGDFVQNFTKFKITRTNIAIDVNPILDFETGAKSNTVILVVNSFGGGTEHNCSYSLNGGSYINFDNQGMVGVHKQDVSVSVGNQMINIKCHDEAGNSARGSVSFNVLLDTSSPRISRIWQSGGQLYFLTISNSECRYSTSTCKFDWSQAVSAGMTQKHSISVVKGKTYYIRCMDDLGNAPQGCSIIANIV